MRARRQAGRLYAQVFRVTVKMRVNADFDVAAAASALATAIKVDEAWSR